MFSTEDFGAQVSRLWRKHTWTYFYSTRHLLKKKFPPSNALALEARALRLVTIGAYNIRSMRCFRQDMSTFFLLSCDLFCYAVVVSKERACGQDGVPGKNLYNMNCFYWLSFNRFCHYAARVKPLRCLGCSCTKVAR